MKFSKINATPSAEILYNNHFVGIPYNCAALTNLATNNVIPAGTVIPSNDANAIGVLLSNVDLSANPNGTIVVHGFIKLAALKTAPAQAAVTALLSRGIQFVDKYGKPELQKYTITYDANGGTGSITDSSSPYQYGTTVTVKASTGLTAPSGKSFSGWALSADAAAKDDNYDPTDTFEIVDNITLYAVWENA